MQQILHFITHIDEFIKQMISNYGTWTYAIMALILFMETGFVVTPFLPGDTLLFAVGLFSNPIGGGTISLNIYIVLLVCTLAPLLGDNCNYWLGRTIGSRIANKPGSKLAPKIEKTQAYFAKYGPKTIVIARWIPIVRTFAPFVAGIGKMPYGQFFRFSALGAILWVWVCVLAGYFLGTIPAVKNNFEFAMLGLVAVSLIPVGIEIVKHRRDAKADREAAAQAETQNG
ncbi:MAG: VTT domain-containing protein [Armatimonadetes bacterium]|nr:VTT domain-containing protein [Armatimonadota bacterium]